MRPWRIVYVLILAMPNLLFAVGGQTCDEATNITYVPYHDAGQLDPGFDPNCPGGPVNDLFYRFAAPVAGTYRFDMCGSTDCCGHAMRLWTDGTCCSGAQVSAFSGCESGDPLYELDLAAGEIVYIEVGKDGGEWEVPPWYHLNVSLIYASPPNGGSTCDDATIVGSLPFHGEGQLEPGYDPNCPGGPVNDRFYRFTAPQTGDYRFDMCGSTDCCGHLMRIWTAGTCCSGASVTSATGCPYGDPYYNLAMTAGQTVFIELGKDGSEWAVPPWFQFHVSSLASKENCPGRAIAFLPYADTGNTTASADDYSNCITDGVARDALFTLTLPVSTWVEVSLCGSGYDTALGIYRDGACPGTTLVACNDDWYCGEEPTLYSTVVFAAEADITYYIRVDGYASYSGDYAIAVTGSDCNSPRELVILQNGVDMRLNWRPWNCGGPYNVYRSTTSDDVVQTANLIGSTGDTTYTDIGVVDTPSSLYFYAVTAGTPVAATGMQSSSDPNSMAARLIDVKARIANATSTGERDALLRIYEQVVSELSRH